MIYEWGKRRFSVPAQEVGEAIDYLRNANGGVCPPSALVEEARPKASPLHPLFTWDNKTAAESWRRQEARQVINAVVMIDERTEEVRPAFLHITLTEDDELREGYAPFDVVLSDEDSRRQVIDEALRYLNGFKRRFAHLSEFRPVLDVIDELQARESA